MSASAATWYKDAVIYELRTRSFYDSDGDGTGDIRGMTEKLDYLEDLGVNTIWLLPFYPSPLRDDGYDISDYTEIHPELGLLRDFKAFLREAHRRHLRVVTELVLNHTSDQHPWFQQSRRATNGGSKRDFYVWSQAPDKFSDARVIFKDFESSNWAWDPVAGAYYWHRFYSHQPDLNFDSPRVRRAVLQVVDFWLSMGVDGLRLDAVPYLFEREGTGCENLPEVHQFLRELRAHVDRRFPDRMLLAEANQWPEDAAAYFGQGDECHMAFHFPLMPRLFMAIRMEDRFPIVDILQQTPAIPENAQWALFLRNHDELTLEMVTDEERDYMYRVYATDRSARINLGIRRRLAPLLGNDRKKIELMNALLFSMPGTPVVYYGDEIGMGDNFYLGDRNGVRTPMQWSSDRNAGFSRANPQRLFLPVIIDPEYHYETVNVENHQNNPHSLLWWMKRLIALRKRHTAFGRGSLEVLSSRNHLVLAFIREWKEERILVVSNLSRFPQSAQLDLGRFQGMTPIELFGGAEFPAIRKRPYMLTLGPHSFYWFCLELRGTSPIEIESEKPQLEVEREWRELVVGKARADLEKALPAHLKKQRWFGGKSRRISRAAIVDVVRVPGHPSIVTVIEVRYADGSIEEYLLPLGFASKVEVSSAIVAKVRIRATGEEGYLHDAVVDPGLGQTLFDAIASGKRLKGGRGAAFCRTTRLFRTLAVSRNGTGEVRLADAEQTNTSVRFGDRFILKLYRRLSSGVSPDLEIGRMLTERASFPATPAVAGWVEYHRPREPDTTLGVLHEYVANEGDFWQYTIDWLGRYYERVLSQPAAESVAPPAPPDGGPESPAIGPEAANWLGGYLAWTDRLARRTAELHQSLAASPDPDFAPEPLSKLYQRSIYQSMRNLTGHVMRRLRDREVDVPASLRRDVRRLCEKENVLLRKFQSLLDRRIGGYRIRCHGDFHLGQVLFTGKDFVIIDFEGEPARPISERRIKRSPLRDVAGMLRSFHYAAYASLPGYTQYGSARTIDFPKLEPWALFWNRWASAVYLQAYLEACPKKLLPSGRSDVDLLLELLLLEKAVYEIGYELDNRPRWLAIPLRALLSKIDPPGPPGGEEKK
jgi:maltose alpha-D-glucosyltransferase/alpha-amylase